MLNPKLSRRTHMLLSQAVARGFCMDPKDPPAPPPDDQKDEKNDDAGKIQVTRAEFDELVQRRVDAALKKSTEAAAAKELKDKEERERKEQEAQGKFRELADAERKAKEEADERAAAAELKARTLEVKDKLRDALAKDHPDYVGVASYIMPLIEFNADTDDAAIDKLIKAAADKFVADNPRRTNSGPPAAGRGNLPPKPGAAPANGKRPAVSTAARSF